MAKLHSNSSKYTRKKYQRNNQSRQTSQSWTWLQQGTPWIWLGAGAVSISLLSLLALLLMIGWKGLIYFWPAPVYQWEDAQGEHLIGQIYQKEQIPLAYLNHQKTNEKNSHSSDETALRYTIKVANRDFYSQDMISVLASDLYHQTQPRDIVVLDRRQNGDFFGYVIGYQGQKSNSKLSFKNQLQEGIASANQIRDEIEAIQVGALQQISNQLDEFLTAKPKRIADAKTENEHQQLDEKELQLTQKLHALQQQVNALQNELNQQLITVQDMAGEVKLLPISDVIDAWYPNQMSFGQKMSHWFSSVSSFASEDPRGIAGEGGIFPAIFGTVFLVLLMSVLVMPLGVLAAVYLHEYAKPNKLTQLIRISVVNLAGVPSIVYGVFGLGFFVYTLGSGIDTIFYSNELPRPTWGTPGLLWSALTLALLTLPVVIVTTEEGLSRIPNSVRDASYALGGTQFETLWRVVLPMATPAILTGLILAIARAAGEVAPLMLVGVVQLAPSLPVDSSFPFIHLERKFMHLGFHIYNLAFQTPNIESARPLVYATSTLLIMVVIGLNMTAIGIRNSLREKYKLLGQD